MFDAVGHTPFVLSYIFVSLLVVILGFILVNVMYKILRAMQSPMKVQIPGGVTNAVETNRMTTATKVSTATTIVHQLTTNVSDLHMDQCQHLFKNNKP